MGESGPSTHTPSTVPAGPRTLGHELEKCGFTGPGGPRNEHTHPRLARRPPHAHAGHRLRHPAALPGLLDHHVFGGEFQNDLTSDLAPLREDRDRLIVWMRRSASAWAPRPPRISS